MSNKNDSDNNSNLSSDILGNSIGALGGFIIGGPFGALIGGVAAPVITDVTKRLLSNRQQERVSTAILLAREKIQANLDSGNEPNDNFFNKRNSDDRPDAAEVWEGVLLNVQQEYQEKKLPYHANLLANCCFEPGFTRERANFLLKLSRNLSYRQLCLLAVFAGKDLHIILRSTDYRNSVNINHNLASILHEIYEMYGLGILSIPGDSMLGVTDAIPAKMNVQGAGIDLYRLMELKNLPIEDLLEVTELLNS